MKSQKWCTADGHEVDLYTINHQHLSNIYYYTNFILPEKYSDDIRILVSQILEERFGGALPYKPKFKWEIDYLKKRRWLRKDGSIVISSSGSMGVKHIKVR